jgi:sugar transferase (PEP-CTERM/EpsH1 system associated)
MKRLLFLVHRMPYPPNKGERVRAFHELKALSKHYRVTLATLAHTKQDLEAVAAVRQWCHKVLIARVGRKRGLLRGVLGILGGDSVTEGFFHSPRLEKKLHRESRRQPFDIALGYSSSMFPYVLKIPATCRILDLVDVDSAKWLAYADDASGPKRWLYQREAKAVCKLEQDAIVDCDAVLLVSQPEANLLGHFPDKVHILNNGVDTEFFSPRKSSQGDNPSLVFTGTMDYQPNIDGVCWFVENVWPQLKQEIPELTFRIVGRDPSRSVRQLAKGPGVQVIGSVPDVRPFLGEAAIAVCPLRTARGVQNKVLEAMAMGKAVIASPPSLEGLDLHIGKEVLQADTPQQWKQTIVELLSQDTVREGLENQARQGVEDRYSWSAQMEPLVDLCHKLCAEPEMLSTAAERSSKESPAPLPESHAKREAQEPTRKWRWPRNWKEKALWLITLGYVIFLIVVNLTPAGQNEKSWLDNISSGMQNFLHIPAYSILMILVTLALTASMRNRLLGIILAALCCFGFGVFMEYTQGLVPGRVVHLSDMLRNGAGIMIVLPVLFFWLWRPPSR